MTIPDDVRDVIMEALSVLLGRQDFEGEPSERTVNAMNWLDAQPEAPEPERWEPVTENSIACACGDRECSTSLEFWEGNNIALCYTGKSGYDGGEVHRVTSDIVLPDDLRLCRRVEVTNE